MKRIKNAIFNVITKEQILPFCTNRSKFRHNFLKIILIFVCVCVCVCAFVTIHSDYVESI